MHWSSVWLYHILSHCCSPSSLESKLHHCLNKLASRQNMQTPLDTKNSLIASGLPALVVTVVLPVFFFFVCFFGYLEYSEISVLRSEVEVWPQLPCTSLFPSVYHPPAPGVCFSSSPSLAVFISFLSLYLQKCGDLFSSSFPPPRLWLSLL